MNGVVKYLVVIILAFIGFVIIAGNTNRDMTQDLSDEDKMLYGFVAETGKQIGEKYHMSQCSIGGGADNGIWLMSLNFQRYGSPLTEKEARRLIIDCVNDYLEMVNKNEKLRPFLKVYPFTAENIDMGIFSYDPVSKMEILHPYITVVSAYEGKIGYCTLKGLNPPNYESEKYETYDEALAILQKEKEQASKN